MAERNSVGPAAPPEKIRDLHRQRSAIVYIRQSSEAQLRDHPGSAASQTDLSEHPRRWGWPSERIEIIDEDQGTSAKEGSERGGILKVLERIRKGEVGIVFIRELSRLSRDPGLTVQLFSACRKAGTLLHYNGVVRDPANETPTELFGLHIAGLLGWLENENRTQQAMAAKVAMAKRGRAVTRPPIGYLRDLRGHWIKDPDSAVQEAVARLFTLYKEFRSLGKVIKYLKSHDLTFPHRVRGEVKWTGIDVTELHSILHNRAYAGDYVYRYRPTPGVDPDCTTPGAPKRTLISKEHHEPYIDPSEFETIQTMLASRRPKIRPIAGKGTALLQGLLRCPTCGRWMETKYWGRSGVVRTAKYRCRRLDDWGATTHRVEFPARDADAAVTHAVLKALKPVELELALTALSSERAKQASLDADLARQIKHAEVKERLEQAVRRRDQLKAKLSEPRAEEPQLTRAEQQELVQRIGGIEALWRDVATTNEDRKHLLRTLISEITVVAASDKAIDLEIVWVGGRKERLHVLLPAGVDALVRDRTAAGHDPRTIAKDLQAAGIVTGSGRPMSLTVVGNKLGRMGLRLKHERRKARETIRQGLLENRPRSEIIRQLQEQAPRLGPWDPQRLSEAIRQLRRGARDVEALPAMLPAEQEKQRVLDLIDKGLAAGGAWKAIAVSLNESGLRPPRGVAFTPIGIRLLYLRAHGRRSLKLSFKAGKQQRPSA